MTTLERADCLLSLYSFSCQTGWKKYSIVCFICLHGCCVYMAVVYAKTHSKLAQLEQLQRWVKGNSRVKRDRSIYLMSAEVLGQIPVMSQETPLAESFSCMVWKREALNCWKRVQTSGGEVGGGWWWKHEKFKTRHLHQKWENQTKPKIKFCHNY